MVAKLGIPDTLCNGPRTSAELAVSVGAHEKSLHRVLRTIGSIGIFSENEAGQFEMTPIAELLPSDVPGSAKAWAILRGEDF